MLGEYTGEESFRCMTVWFVKNGRNFSFTCVEKKRDDTSLLKRRVGGGGARVVEHNKMIDWWIDKSI